MALHFFHLNKSTVFALLLATAWAGTSVAWAQNVEPSSSTTSSSASTRTASTAPTAQREKIGLVLSGGGARGLAHLGVLRELERQHIPIDYIAGTSAGALIGGMYASGLSVDEIELRIKDLDLQAISFATEDRRKTTQNRRNLDYQANNALDVSVSDSGGVSLPIAISDGTQVEAVLRDILKDRPYDIDFDKLPIPFRAVASDLATGKIVVIKNGQMAQALRASMAIPGVFAPVAKGDQLLVDGMVARNLPVDVARQMGATRIIAVDVGSDLRTKDELNSVVAVSDQIVGLLVKRNVDEQVATLTKKDILIRPPLGKLSNLDFKSAHAAIKIGETALESPAMRRQLASMAVQPSTYAQRMSGHHAVAASDTNNITIDFVRVETNGLASPTALESQLDMQAGQTFNIERVNQDIDTLMTSGRISLVRYAIKRVGEHNELVYQVTEKDSATNAVRAGLEVEGDSATNQQFTLHVSHRKVWLNRLGGEWRNHLALGKTTIISSELNQPLTTRGNVYVRPSVKLTYEKHPVYIGNDLASEYNVSRIEYGFLAGTPIQRIGEWGVGASRRRVSVSGNQTNPAVIIPSDSVWRTTLDAQLTLDQLDDVALPTEGYFLRSYARISPQSNNGSRFWQTGLQTLWAKSLRQHTINLRFEAGASNNNRSVYFSPYNLGGYQRLSGYSQNQFLGNYMAFGSATYRYRTAYAVLNNPLYIGASLEAGNTWANRDDIGHRLRYSASLFGALNTPIGPAQLGVGISPKGNARFYFFLGRTFSETP